MKITYKIEKNQKYRDYRINEYHDNIWFNAYDNGWTLKQATEQLKRLKNHYELDLYCDEWPL